jgi:hypothetical protein
MKKTIKLTPADPYLDQWKDLWLTKEYEPDAWTRSSKWEKLWEMEEIKEEEEEYVSAAEARFLKEWQDIARAAETNVALKDLLDQVKMMYKLTKIK